MLPDYEPGRRTRDLRPTRGGHIMRMKTLIDDTSGSTLSALAAGLTMVLAAIPLSMALGAAFVRGTLG